MVDGFDGERYNIEDPETSDEKLIEILADTNKYYPADGSGNAMAYGRSYFAHMRDQAAEIENELELRAADAREEDRREMRDDDERL